MRYIHLYFTCIKRSIISRLEYKKDTFISIFSFLVSNVCSILSIYFILNSIPSIEGWTMGEIGFLYGFSMIPVAIDHLFSDDLWMVAYHKVKAGEMDRYFLRPVPVLFQVIAETFQPEGFGEMIVGIIMLSVCGNMVNINWSFGVILLLIIASLFGAVIITSLKILTSSLAFIFKRSGPLLQIVYEFITYSRYPLKIYPKVIQFVLTFIFPFALVIYFPIEILLYETINPYLLSIGIIVFCSFFLFISICVWNVCIKKYESSGS